MLLLLRFMAPKKRKLKRYADELPELAHLPRKQLLQLVKRLKDGSCDLDNLGTSTDYYDSSFHYHFDQCCCSDEFRLITALAKTQKLEYLDATLLMQHLLTCCPEYADRFAETLQRHPSSHANPWHCIIWVSTNSTQETSIFYHVAWTTPIVQGTSKNPYYLALSTIL